MAKLVVDSSSAAVPGLVAGGLLSDDTVFKYGSSSLLFNGTSAYARFAPADYFAIGTGDFTISFWIKTTKDVTGQASFPRVISPAGSVNAIGTLQLWYGSGSPTSSVNAIELPAPQGGTVTVSTVDTVSDNNWHHVEFSRQAGTSRSFLDGVLKQSAADTNNYTRLATDGIVIGARSDFNALTFIGGYLDDLHFSKIARHTASFTPPAAEEAPDANTLLLVRGDAFDATFFTRTYLAPLIDLPVTGSVTLKQDTARGQKLFDIYWGGKGRVYGTVKIKGTPNYAVARRVRLFRERDGFCVGETWSDPITGNYEFLYLDERERYTALAYDYQQSFRVVGADNLTPEVTP